MSEPLRRGWCPGALRPMMARDGLLVRLRLSGGHLDAAKAHALAALSAFYGNGFLDLSARANLQLRGVSDANLTPLLDALDDLGLLDHDAEAESVRNVIVSPLAGLSVGLDVGLIARDLETRLVTDTVLHALPGKFGFLLDDGGEPTLAGIPSDVRFDLHREDGEDRAWIGLGGTRDHAVPLAFCAPHEIVEAAAYIAKTFLSLASRSQPPVHRMVHLVDRLGPIQTVRAFGGAGGTVRLDYSGAFLDRPPVGVSTIDGRHVLGLGAPFGRFDHTMLAAAAEAAEAHGGGFLRLTPWRCLLLPGIDTDIALEPFRERGFIVAQNDPRLRLAACVGMTGCERATTSVTADAAALLDLVEGFSGSGIAIHVSGCSKGCARNARTALTLVGREGAYDLVHAGKAADAPTQRGLDLPAVRGIVARLKGLA